MTWLGLPAPLWQALILSIELAAVTTLVLMVVGIPLAHWLNTTRFFGRNLLEVMISLPIVLPPTVIGFYLLVSFAPQTVLGQFWQAIFGHGLTFSFAGLVVGSVLYSFPFAVQPYQAALRSVPKALVEAATAMGATSWQVTWQLRLRWARAGIFAGSGLAFAHTMGEFGVVLMLGGNLEGTTRVSSIALYDLTQALEFEQAHRYAAVLLGVAMLMLIVVSLLQKRMELRQPNM